MHGNSVHNMRFTSTWNDNLLNLDKVYLSLVNLGFSHNN